MTTSTLDIVQATATLDPDRLRETLAHFPSGVTIVTTADRDGTWWGFTATAFCSLSAQPPLVLVCLAKSARCHEAFLDAESWVIHVLGSRHTDLATRFASKGVDKFAAGGFGMNADGLPVLEGACSVLECSAYARYDGGDHTILVGLVTACRTDGGPAAVYFQRGFHSIGA